MVGALETRAAEQVSCETSGQAGQAHSCLIMSVLLCNVPNALMSGLE